jgi:hypothetical protein
MKTNMYVFGYGSLVSKQSIAHTIGREPDELILSKLKGWIRNWEVVVDNTCSNGHFEHPFDHSIPERILALNVRLPVGDEKPTDPNGVLFNVTYDDLNLLDLRESYYERRDITQFFPDAPGIVYAYIGRPDTYASADNAIIPKSYVHLIKEHFTYAGTLEYEYFNRSTVWPNKPVITPSIFCLKNHNEESEVNV